MRQRPDCSPGLPDRSRVIASAAGYFRSRVIPHGARLLIGLDLTQGMSRCAGLWHELFYEIEPLRPPLE